MDTLFYIAMVLVIVGGIGVHFVLKRSTKNLKTVEDITPNVSETVVTSTEAQVEEKVIDVSTEETNEVKVETKPKRSAKKAKAEVSEVKTEPKPRKPRAKKSA